MGHTLLMQPAAKLATYADLVAMPDDVRAEVVSGEVVTEPSPLPRHSRAAGALNRLIAPVRRADAAPLEQTSNQGDINYEFNGYDTFSAYR